MMSLNPYFGSLVSGLESKWRIMLTACVPDPGAERDGKFTMIDRIRLLRPLQTKAFCKFLPVIFVLYLGFLTTFTMLARDRMTLNDMSWLLIKVFFG